MPASTVDIRNVALVGHNNSGKSSLADWMLYKAGAVPRAGSVADGTSVFDTDPDEKERKATLDLGIASCTWEGKEINIFDCPGYPDLISQTLMAYSAVETAVVCVNAFSGVMVNTRRTFEAAVKLGIPRVLMITKIDQENVDLAKTLEGIRENFGRECLPILLPDRTGTAASRLVNLLTEPAAAPPQFQEYAREAMERIAEVNDQLLEKYLESGSLSPAEILGALPDAITQGRFVPILCSSVPKDLGIDQFLTFIATALPSPAARPRKATDLKSGEEKEIGVESSGPWSAQVIKGVGDLFVRKYAFLRVMTGTFQSGSPFLNVRSKKTLPIGGIFKPFGKDMKQLKPVSQVVAGDVCVVTKAEEAQIGDTFGDPTFSCAYAPTEFPTPMISVAIEPKTKQDEARMIPSLQKMAEGDPTFRVGRDPQTGEFLITGVSQFHLDITLAKMKRLLETQVNTRTPKIPFRETITARAEGHHKHKKQTGGHGQYGEAYLRLEPAPRGSGFEFVDSIVGGKIPSQFIPSIEKGVKSCMARGVLAGYPIQDIRVEVFDGSYHEVDSGNESFEIAGYFAFLDGFQKARPVLLEPIVKMDVVVPAAKQGSVTQQIISKRGQITTIDTQGNYQVVHCEIPLMEIMNYGTELNSITGGEGAYTIEFLRYDQVPAKIAEGIIARARAAREAEQK